MRQLALELNGYPRPIAWTLSEVERAVGDRDRHNMLLTALEEITRYLVMIQLARYTEYWAQGRGSQEVERELAGLRRPSFGHYVTALRVLDDYLAEADDPYAIHVSMQRRSPAMLRFVVETGTNAKKLSILGFLGRVVELRNQAKGHGYTDQQGARAVIAHLQPALTELLNHMPLLIARPLVWIERIEYIDVKRWVVTLLELMGTQRARQLHREVQEPGNLKKGFLYMWDGESSPLQLTPFLHLEQVAHDELVYVLAGFSGEPVYQARGSADARRRPDQLMSQLEERAPFLLKSAPTTTTARPPDASRFYRHAVEVALADGRVSPAEAARLEAVRIDLGLLAGEAAVIHAELGWCKWRTRPSLTKARNLPKNSPHRRTRENAGAVRYRRCSRPFVLRSPSGRMPGRDRWSWTRILSSASRSGRRRSSRCGSPRNGAATCVWSWASAPYARTAILRTARRGSCSRRR
jgi:hypothetical protein